MNKNKTAVLVSFLLVLAEYVTIIKYFVRAMSGGVLICSLIYLYRHLPRFFQSKFFWLPVMYYSWCFILLFIDPHPLFSFRTSIYFLLADFMRYICPIGMFLALVYNGDYRIFRRFCICVCVYLFIMSIITIRADVGTSRLVGYDTGYGDLTATADAIMTGSWGYNVVHQLPFVMFGAVVCSKHIAGKMGKVLMAVFGFFIFIAIYRSGFGVATILSLILLAFSMALRLKNHMIMFGSLIFFSILFLLGWYMGIVSDCLEWFLTFFTEENIITIKINEIIEASHGNVTGDAEARTNLYSMSWEGFLEHPFFGGGWSGGQGGHAFLLDVLCKDGMVGFFLLLSCYLSTLFKMKSFLPKQFQALFTLAVIISLTMMFLKNLRLSSHIISLMFLMPSFFVMKKECFIETSGRVRRYFRVSPLEIR